MSAAVPTSAGGRFEFDDGGSYAGTWLEGMSHGHGVCTGPRAHGEYAGAWQHGFETSGVYTWRNGNFYEGQWLQGRRHGLGVESKAQWLYRGEWTQGYKGRYGVKQSTVSGAMYEGTWTSGVQDGYGVETYADGGIYQGQWLRGIRHGYGVRQSVSYDLAARYRSTMTHKPVTAGSLSASTILPGADADQEALLRDRDKRLEEGRGGFVLIANTTLTEEAKANLKLQAEKRGRSSIRKTIAKGMTLIRQRSTGDLLDHSRPSSRQSGGSVRSTSSTFSQSSGTSASTNLSIYSALGDDGEADRSSFISQPDLFLQQNVIERYWGEWKGDKRSGYGVCERTDGVRYEGEWLNNRKNGYGVTTLPDGTRLEGKYKNNILVSSGKNSKLFNIRSSKLRDRVESSVMSAHRAADIAKQKAEIAIARQVSARVKAEQSQEIARQAVKDSSIAKDRAKEYSPAATTSGLNFVANRQQEEEIQHEYSSVAFNNQSANISSNCSTPLLTHNSVNISSNTPVKGQPGAPRNSPGNKLTSIFRSMRPASSDARPSHSDTFNQNMQSRNQYQPITGQDARMQQRNTSMLSQSNYGDNRTIRAQSAGPVTNDYIAGGSMMYTDEEPLSFTQATNYSSVNSWGNNMPRAPNGLHNSPQSPANLYPASNGYHKQSSDHAWLQTYAQNSQHTYGPGMTSPNVMSPGGAQLGGAQISNALPLAQPGYRPYDGAYDDIELSSMSQGLERRNTLPSIIKEKSPARTTSNKDTNVPVPVTTANTGTYTRGVGSITVQTGPRKRHDNVDTYVIEKGVRRKVKSIYEDDQTKPAIQTDYRADARMNSITSSPLSRELSPTRIHNSQTEIDDDAQLKKLPLKYKLESPRLIRRAAGGDMGSVPDVSTTFKQNYEVLPREIVSVMSQQRREELIKERAEEERRRRNQIVLRLGDVVDWCERHYIVVLVIAINLGLLSVFFNLFT